MDGQLQLNHAGMMITATWEANAARYPGVALDAYVVMPNHMHAIVFLGTDPAIELGPNLSRIVQSFKSITTMEYTRGVRSGMYPAYDRVLWQRSFQDKILESERSLSAAQSYIEGNPGQHAQK